MGNTARKGAIGVFDSGFGGISILKEIEKALPQYKYLYLGDTARTPYGNRSPEAVCQFTIEAVEFLFKAGCQLIIIACNTASAEALRKIQQEYLPIHYPDRRILGVIIPAVEEAVERTKTERIGVLGTEGTVRSKTFPQELKKLKKSIVVFQQAAPLLVPLVEEGVHRTPAAQLILKEYLRPLLAERIDTLILGCTHYGHFESMVKANMGKGVALISEGKIVARKLKDYLQRHPEIESTLSHAGTVTFYTTDMTDRFKRIGEKLFGRSFTPKKAVLGA